MSEIARLSSLLRWTLERKLDIPKVFFEAVRWTRRLAVKLVAEDVLFQMFKTDHFGERERERRHFELSKPLKITGIVSSADCGPPAEM